MTTRQTAGCSDGSREGFKDTITYPNIAACSGAFTVPGVHNSLILAPTCNRKAGNEASSLTTGCSASDICAAGWHVCTGFNDVNNAARPSNGGSNNGCYNVQDYATDSFFATRQSGNGAAFCNNDPQWSNDVFGCGTGTGSSGGGDPLSGWGADVRASCPGLSAFSHNWCNKLSSNWQCTDTTGGWSEAYTITHSAKTNGGVMCCRDGLNTEGAPEDVEALTVGPACEGVKVSPTCPDGLVIHFLSADYGRKDTTTCPSSTASKNTNTKCRHKGILKKAFKECEGKSSCSITATLKWLEASEACSDTSKYFWGKYECVNPACLPKAKSSDKDAPGNAWGLKKCKRQCKYSVEEPKDKDKSNFQPEKTTQTVTTCEGGQVGIYCPAGLLIKIDSIFYGRKDGTTCPHSCMSNQACSASGAQDKIKAFCNDKQTCTFGANNENFGDPCVGTYKYVQGNYKCYENPSNDWKTKVCHAELNSAGKPTGVKTQVYVTPTDLKTHLDHANDFVGDCAATKIITVNLAYDYDNIKSMNDFIDQFLADLYAAAGVDPSIGIFFVQSVKKGSVVVDVEIRDSPYAADPTTPTSADAVATDLEAQAADPDSKLYDGEYTQHTSSLTVQGSSSSKKKDNSLAIGLGVAAGVVLLVAIAFVVFRFARNKRSHQRVHSEQTFSHGDQTEKNGVPPAKAADPEAAMPAGNADELARLAGAVQADADAQRGEKVWVFNRDGQKAN